MELRVERSVGAAAVSRTRSAIEMLALLALVAVPLGAGGQDWAVDHYVINGGGEVLTEGDDWQASGTLGQPGSTPLRGGPWEATGGFWFVTVTRTEVLFEDGFER